MSDRERVVSVKLGRRGYDIEIGAAILERLGEFVTRRQPLSHAIVVTDQHVETPHAATATRSLAERGAAVDLLVIEPGEQSKSIRIAELLWQKLLDLRADRKSLVVAVGGGVIGDLAGFAAATYARGLSLVQVPTSLLAQVDSSVGGKVGVNLPDAKNMVGAFWQPLGVLIDIETLVTLPEREYRSGLAEVVKYGVILDAAFFEYLQGQVQALIGRDFQVLQHVVTRCCQLKASVVEQDEREESGQRAVLNYGHTFCHALETATGYARWLHGEAVSIGMICASKLAERLGRIDEQLTGMQRQLLLDLGLPVAVPELDPEVLLAAMMRDKKVEHGQLRFVLPSMLGRVELVSGVDAADVRAVLKN